MRSLPLGTTGEEVSALCLGTMYFGSREGKDISFRLLDQYIQAGGNFLDSANIYAHWVRGGRGGESETLLGEWMRQRKNRQRLFIATKVGFEYLGTNRGLRSSQIEEECDKSLKRLGIENIDLYYAHVDDRTTPLEESLAVLDRLVKAGKVRYIGASNYLAWRLEEAYWVSNTNGYAAYCCIQQRYSYLRPKPGAGFSPQVAANSDLLDYCRHRSVTLLAYSVLLSGAFTREDRPLSWQYLGADSQARLKALRRVSAEIGVSPNQVVLAWMLKSDPIVLPLIAASTQEQLQENLEALEISLNQSQMELLNNAGGEL